MAKRDNVKVGGKLELDVLLNAKNLDKQVKTLLGKLENSQKSFGPADDTLGNAKKSLRQAEALLSQSSAATKKFIAGEQKFYDFNSKQRKQISKDLEGVSGAIKNSKNAYNQVNEAAKLLSDSPKLQKELNSAFKEGSASIRKLEQTNNALIQASNPVIQKRKEQAALAKKEVEADKKRVAAKKLDAARIAQQGRERAVKAATGKRTDSLSARDLSGLSAPQKKIVEDALRGRLGLAQHRQNLATNFDKSASAINKTDKAVARARAGLDAYNQLKVESVKLSKESAAVDRGIAEQRKKEAQINKAFGQREKEEAAQRKKDDLTRAKGLEAAAAQRSKRELDERKATAKQAAKQYEQFIAEQDALDEKAYRARQKLRKAETKAKEAELAKQKRAQDKSSAEQIRNTERLAAARQKRAENLIRQRALVSQKGIVAKDVLGKYGVSGFKGLDFKAVDRQDLKALQDYAKALQQMALQRKLAAKQGGTQAQIDRTTAAYQRQTQVVRQLEARYRALHSPLQQVNLLFRQFFRFAIGYGALYGMLGAIRSLIGGIVDLDESLKSIQAITASTDAEMRKLDVTIKRVATTTKFTTTEIAAATQILGQAGVSAKELPSALQATADFAAATASNLEIAADLITTTRNVFKELDDNTLADQLTKAINISKLTAADLKTILSLSAQTAQSYNLTSEQYLAAVTTLRNAGIKASTVATGLRQGLIEIFAPDSSTIKALKERYSQLGDEITEEAIKQRFFGFTKSDNPLLSVLSELKRLGFADEAQKEFQRAFDVRAANAIKALIKNYDQLAEAESRITFGLSSAEAAEIQMESLRNSLSNLGAAFTVFGSAVGGDAVRGLESFTDTATEALNALTNLDVQLKKQGKDGLSSALFPALAGGAAGGFLGKGVKNKFLLGGLGTLAGGAAGLAPAATTGSTGAAVAGLGGSAILTGLLAYLGFKDFSALKNAGGAKPGQLGLDLGESAARTFLGGGGGKFSQLVAKAGGAKVLALIPYIGPLISFVFTALSILGVVNSLFSDGGSAFNQADNKLKGALAELDSASAEAEKVKNEIDEFDVDAAKSGSGTGKTASAVANLQQQFLDYDASVKRVFGSITEGNKKRFDEILGRFSNAGLSERQGLTSELQELTGIVGDPAEISRQAYDLSSTVNSLQAKSSGLLSEINSYMIGINEDIEQELLAGNEADKVAVSISDLFLNSGKLREAVLGRATLDPREEAELAGKFLQDIAEIRREAYTALSGKREAAAQAAIEAQINRALAAGSEESRLDLSLVLRNIVLDVNAIDGSLIETLQQRREILQDRLAEINAAKTGSSFFRVSSQSRNEESTARESSARGIQATLELIDQEVAALEAARTNAIEETRQAAEATINSFAELASTGAGQASIESALASASNGEAKQALIDILSVPDGLKKLADEVSSAGVNADDLSNPKLVGNIAAIVSLMATIAQISNTTIPSEQDLKEYRANLPNPNDIALIENLKKRIANLGGKNKQDIGLLINDNDENPINQLRDALAREQSRAINRTLEQIKEIDPKGDETTLDKKNVTKLNTLKVRLAKEEAALLQLDIDAQEKITAEREKFISIQLKRRKQAANLSKTSAEEDIGLAGAKGDASLFRQSIEKIDKANAELIQVFEQELIRDGILRGTELFKAEMEERRKQLRALETNHDQFLKYVQEFTSTFKDQADALRATTVSSGGAGQDAVSQSLGAVGDSRRRQRAALDQGALAIDAAGIGSQIGLLEDSLAAQEAAGLDGEVAKTTQTIQELRNELDAMDQKSAALTLTMMENSEVAEERAQAELIQLGNMQALLETFQDSEHAFKNFAENLQSTIVGTVEEIGDALTDFIVDGGSFSDMLGNILHDFGRELLNQGIQTLINEGLQALITKLPQELFGGLAGNLATSVAGNAASAVGEGAEAASTALAISTALAPATIGMQTANTQMFLAGTTLNAAGLALNTAATQLAAAAIGSSIGIRTGGVFSSSGVQRFARGGIIRGPGTGTSDSISGVHMNGKGGMPIRVSNGESILNAKATQLLGEDFIHAMNSGKISGFQSGAVADRSTLTASGAKVPTQSQVSPTVNNQNDVNIVNAIDSSSVVAAGLETAAGGRAIFNFLKANKSKVQRIIQ